MLRNKNINTILIISIFLFSIKWILSFYFFKENLSVRIIFESVTDGHYYYPLIKYLAFFEFNNSFDPNIDNLKIIPLPIAGIFFHSIFFKIFGFMAFIVMELLAIFIFLIIFYKIFSYFLSENESILLSLLLFTIPSILAILNIENLPYINLLKSDFYTLRVPRPMINALYLFTFLYLLISMEKEVIINKKKFILLGLILGLSLSSFYYFFVIEATALLFFLIYKFKFDFLKKILEQRKNFLLSIFFFLFSILPFFLNLLFHEKDFTERQCVFNLDFEKKSVLLDHYLNGYTKIEFLSFFIVSSFLVYLANKKKILNCEIINIFFILFLASAFAPIIFITLSNKSCVLYHFNNAIVVWAFLFVIIYFVTILKHFFKIELNTNVCRIFFVLISFLYCLNTYLEKENKYNNQFVKNERIEFQKVTRLINDNINISNSTFMTFDSDLMIWAILNNVKYLSLIDCLLVPKTDVMIENDLIKSFKFLGLNVYDFKYFLRNKKESWRYLNRDVATFFFYKYQANSLITFNNSKNFDAGIAKNIFSSSPLYQQQSAIPNEEFARLEKKFKKTKLENFNEPEIIVLEKLRFLNINIIIKKQNYCKLYDGNIYALYIKKNSGVKCN